MVPFLSSASSYIPMIPFCPAPHPCLSPHASLSVQEPAVLCDLHLQPHLDVQQELVLGGLLLDADTELLELGLQAVDMQLELAQLQAIAATHLRQLLLQARFLVCGGV